MRSLIFILGLAWSMRAGSSLVLSPGIGGQMNAAPLTGVQRLEFRIHNFQIPAPSSSGGVVISGIFQLSWAGVSAFLASNNELLVSNNRDTIGGLCNVHLAGRSDILVRVQRDPVRSFFTCEFWNHDGSGYQIQQVPLTAVGGGTSEGIIGGAHTSVHLAYLRVSNTLIDDGSRAPTAAPSGSVANWRFNNTLANSSGIGGYQISLPVSPSYSSTPVYPPATRAKVFGAPFWTDWIALRAGDQNTLSGGGSFSLSDSDELTYQWQQLEGPSTIKWSNRNEANPVIRGLIFGTYKVLLRVLDDGGRSAETTLSFGAVATDLDDKVILPDPRLTALLGPMPRFGVSAWPWAENRHKFLSEYFGGLLDTNPLYQTYWNVSRTGTVSLTQNSATVTGNGTEFLSTFACDGSYGDRITVWWQRPDGSTGHADREVVSCQSDTALTINSPWDLPSQVERTYAHASSPTAFDAWVENVNFYDVVLAHYALYYRTGFTRYRDYARTLADRFWESPAMDEGYSSQFPRRRSLAGLVLRALDGRPEMWPGLRRIMEADLRGFKGILNTDVIGDLREEGYKLHEVALGALFDPDPVQRAQWVTAVNDSVNNRWAPQQQPDGNYLSGYDPDSGTATLTQGSATVTGTNFSSSTCATTATADGILTLAPGSTQVTGVGTNFTAAHVGLNIIVPALRAGNTRFTFRSVIERVNSASSIVIRNPFESEASVVDGSYRVLAQFSPPWMVFGPTFDNLDSEPYTCTLISSTELLLDRPYEGTSGTKNYMKNNLVGRGTQPFMLGLVGKFMNTAYAATGNPNARSIILGVARWIKTTGYWPERRGLYYGRVFPGCEPDASTTSNCADDSSGAGGNHFFGSAIYGMLSASYLLDADPALRELADTMFSANFGKPGFGGLTDPNGFYNVDLDDRGFAVIFDKAKDFGVTFGFGFDFSWAAARSGPPRDPFLQDMPVAFNLGGIPNAAEAQVSLTDPNGQTSTTTCQSSPCLVPIDASKGDHIIQLRYRTATGSVLSQGEPYVLVVR